MATRLQSIEPADLAVTITPMRRRHLRSVLRIEQQVYPRPWSVGLFMGELALRSSRLYVVARVGTTVVGYAGMMFVVDDGHITTIAVDPAWQRLGIATRLLLCIVRQGVARDVKNMTLEVRMSNVGAQHLYRRFGFAPAGVRRGYYVENAEDALVMWAHDVDLAPTAQRLDEIEAGLPGVGRLEGFDT